MRQPPTLVITWHLTRPRANVYRGYRVRRYWLTSASLDRCYAIRDRRPHLHRTAGAM